MSPEQMELREPDFGIRVAECISEGEGFWKPCSGCYETEDGQNVHGYPYSETFQCVLGGGCSECGGLGAVWDATDYEAITRPSPSVGVGETAHWKRIAHDRAVSANGWRDRAMEAERSRDGWKAHAEHHFGHMRAALDLSYALKYPIDPTLLEAIADQIDCGSGCDNASRDFSTNSTECRLAETTGCAFDNASQLRDFAKALRIQAWTLALAAPPPALVNRELVEALTDALSTLEHAEHYLDYQPGSFEAADLAATIEAARQALSSTKGGE